MFPTAHSTVYYNEAGEPLGWSDESSYDPTGDEYGGPDEDYPTDEDYDPSEDDDIEEVRDDFLCTNCDGSGCLDCRSTFYDTEDERELPGDEP
jgi:hypothetical protein